MKGVETKIQTGSNQFVWAQIKEGGFPAWLIGVHGIGEHHGRHEYLYHLFGNQFNICTYDLKGHGKSSGPKGDCDHFSQFAKDLQSVLSYLQIHYKMSSYVLFGHSMGALIVADFIQNLVEKSFYPKRIFLSSPPIGIGGPLGTLAQLIPGAFYRTLANFSKSPSVKGLVNLESLSHDQNVAKNYVADPMNCLSLNLRLVSGMMATSLEVFTRPIRPLCPAFCSVGSEDKIISVKDVVRYVQIVDKAFQLKIIKGAYHEIHNEIDVYQKEYFDYLTHSLIL